MRVSLRTFMQGLLCTLAGLQAGPAIAEDWLPVAPDELHMTSLPQAPGAAAVILYRQVDRNDYHYYEDVYLRIKILTDEGRRYADVEIPYYDFYESVRGLEARTIHADGSIVPFTGTVYDKVLRTSRNGETRAKSFQLPAVETGCVVEYRYRHHFNYGWTYNSQWILSSNLYTRTAKFSLVPNRGLSLRWSWPNGLPPGTAEPRLEKDSVILEAHDVPAFVAEDHMPPENELQSRVDFIYTGERHFETDPVIFWRKFATDSWKRTQLFIDQKADMQRALAQVVAPGDTPEQKLRKIYARVQRVTNLSYEPQKTEQETAREERERARSAADVWDQNTGREWQINWLFLALVHAAGMQADPVLVSRRNAYIFDPRLMNPRQLDAGAVLVNLDGKDLYLDPGTPFTPFGLEPWNETDTRSLRLTAEGGAWVVTPLPAASESRIERHAVLKLTDGGTLEGKLTVRFTGLEALALRLAQRNNDDTGRRQFLEKEIEATVASGIDVRLTNTPDWGASEPLLVAEFDLKIPGWATSAGRRELIPVGVFGGDERHTFEHATRTYPLYFSYPHQHLDDVTIELPPGWRVESVPAARSADLKVLRYQGGAQNAPGALHLTRELTINLYEAAAKSYGPVQAFFQTVRTADAEQAVITRDATAAR